MNCTELEVYLDHTTNVPRPHHEHAVTAPRAYLACTTTLPEEYQWFGSLTFQREIL